METPDERALATEVAERSITLLTNDGTLPVDPASVGRVAVLGPNADEVMALFGNYSFENHLVSTHYSEAADAVQVPTVLDTLRERFGPSVVDHRPGCGVMNDDRLGDRRRGRAGRRRPMWPFVVVGDKAGHFKQGTVGEGTDRSELSLPGVQAELVDAVIDTGTPDGRRAAQRSSVHPGGRGRAGRSHRRGVVPRPGRRGGGGRRAHRRRETRRAS